MYDNKVLSIYNNDDYYKIRKVNPILVKYLKTVVEGIALDIGCGVGVNTKFIQQKGYIVRGVDINRDAIERAIQLGVHAELIDIRKFEWDTKYDLITSFYVLQHFLKKESMFIVNKSSQYLNENGILIVAIFIDRINTISPEDISFILNDFELITEKYWTREDLDHGKKHFHKGYYCVYKKREKQR